MENIIIKTDIKENTLFKRYITTITDRSDDIAMRLRIYFINGYGISIIRGKYTYGGLDGLFEIAPLNKDDNLDGSIIGIESDDVEGYLTEKEVFDRILKIALL